MDQLLENLIHSLEQEIDLWGTMNDLLVEKQKSVIAADTERLDGLGLDIETLQGRIRQIEGQRRDLFEQAAQSLERNPRELNLKSLSQLLPETYAERVLNCRAALSAIVERIREINAASQQLLTHAVHMVGASCTILSGIISPHATVYGQTGVTQNRGQIGRMLSQNI